jgi:protein MAK11
LIATQETGNRITCLGAFVMDGKASDVNEVEEDAGAEQDGQSEEDSEADV